MTEHTQPRPRMAGQRRGRVWIAVVMWLLVGGLIWAYFVAGAVAFLHLNAGQANGGGGAAGMDPGRSTGFSVSFGLVAVATLLYTRFAGGIAWAGLGMRRRDGRRRIFGGAAGTAVLYVAAMVVAAWVFQGLTISRTMRRKAPAS